MPANELIVAGDLANMWLDLERDGLRSLGLFVGACGSLGVP